MNRLLRLPKTTTTSTTISSVVFVLIACIVGLVSSRQRDDEGYVSTIAEDGPPGGDAHRDVHEDTLQRQDETLSTITRDPLRWIWIDESSLGLTWSSKFSLSLNDAVKGYGLTLTDAQQMEPFATTTIYDANNLQHQFGGLKSNVTYAGRLEALVGPHHWPYNLLNFTFASAALTHGVALGQRSLPDRPESSKADLRKVAVGVTLRWSHSPFTTGVLRHGISRSPSPSGSLTSSEWDADGGPPEGLRPEGYLLQVWDHKHLLLKLTTSVEGIHEGCIANIEGLTLDTAYKATLEGLLAGGRKGTTLSFSIDTGGFYVAGGALTTDGVSECYSSLQVRCPSSERCVSPYWICDGAPDCPDGEDEIGCDKSPCNGFRCWDDMCIPAAWRCDGHHDCKDGDDEYACSDCNEGEVACSTVGFCFYPNATCDGIPDCPDGWDESLSVCGGKECTGGELPCWDNDHCVPHSHLCDGTPDCPTAEDEDHSFCVAFKSMQETTTLAVDLQASLCEQRNSFGNRNCSQDDYQCESGECIPRMYLCNGHFDCHAGDDEEPNACSAINNNLDPIVSQKVEDELHSEDICGENMLLCPSGKCIESEKCLPNCDEKHIIEICEEDSIGDMSNEIERNMIDDDYSLETKLITSAEASWEEEQEVNDFRPLVLDQSRILESGNTSTEHSLPSPSLQENDFETTEGVNHIPHANVTQDQVPLVIENGTVEVDVANSSENELEPTEESKIEELDISPIKSETQSVSLTSILDYSNSSIPDDIPDIEDLEMESYEDYGSSIIETRFRDLGISGKNGSSSLMNLDSDEDDYDEIPFLTSIDSSSEDNVPTENETISSEEVTIDSAEVTHSHEIGLNDQNDSYETTLMNNDSYTITEESLYEVTTSANTEVIDDDSNSTSTEEGTHILTSTTQGLLENVTTEEPETSEVTEATDKMNQSTEQETQTLSTAATSSTTTTFTTTTSTATESTVLMHLSTTEASTTHVTKDDDVSHATKESMSGDQTTTLSSTEMPISITTEPENWKEIPANKKNLTVLIAVHSISNESEPPQYIIHGLDGSTYHYEVVGVNDNDQINKTNINTGESNEHSENYEVSGSVHELSYLQGMVSSATQKSSYIVCMIFLSIVVLISK